MESDSGGKKLDLLLTENDDEHRPEITDTTKTADNHQGFCTQSTSEIENQKMANHPDTDEEHQRQKSNQVPSSSRNMFIAVTEDIKHNLSTNVTGVSDGEVRGGRVIGLQYNKQDNRRDNRQYATLQPQHIPYSDPPPGSDFKVGTKADLNVHVTGVSGGVVIDAEVIGLQYNKHDNRQDNRHYVNMHLTKNIIQDSGVKRERQKMRQATKIHIEEWTKGMVHTAATQSILDLILQGKTWVTVTGSPGEGKTTAAYLTLNKLHGLERRVYDIRTPEDYSKVKNSSSVVLLFNDIFGSNKFNHDNLEKWQPVLTDILDMKEHRDFKNLGIKKCSFTRQKIPLSVIFVSRASVLNSATCHLGRFKDHVLESVLNLTLDMKINTQERLDIWKYHADMYNVLIDEKTVMDICSMSLSHGFPHCCRLFASMYSDNKNLNMTLFFSTPIKYLNQTMESLLNDSTTGPLLREMVRHGGFLQLDSINEDETRYQYKTVANRLKGTYLIEDNGCVVFHHPSVFDCAALLFAEMAPYS